MCVELQTHNIDLVKGLNATELKLKEARLLHDSLIQRLHKGLYSALHKQITMQRILDLATAAFLLFLINLLIEAIL